MLVVHVHVQVKPEHFEAFRRATIENARNSIREPGIARFDVIQQIDDPTRLLLVEAYRTDDLPACHKVTAHYAAWRDAVADMMVTPRASIKYTSHFPDDAGWKINFEFATAASILFGPNTLKSIGPLAAAIGSECWPSSAEDGVIWVRELCARLRIPPLSAWGVGPDVLPELIEKSAQTSSMKGNPSPLTREELQHILESAL